MFLKVFNMTCKFEIYWKIFKSSNSTHRAHSACLAAAATSKQHQQLPRGPPESEAFLPVGRRWLGLCHLSFSLRLDTVANGRARFCVCWVTIFSVSLVSCCNKTCSCLLLLLMQFSTCFFCCCFCLVEFVVLVIVYVKRIIGQKACVPTAEISLRGCLILCV